MTTKQIFLVFACLTVASYIWKGFIAVEMLLFFSLVNGGLKTRRQE